MRSLVRVVVVAVVAMGASLAITACKQGSGERCQVDTDCEGDLTCTTLGFCGTDNDNPIDAGEAFDARPDAADEPDAAAADAAADAATDAAPIDAVVFDASIDAT